MTQETTAPEEKEVQEDTSAAEVKESPEESTGETSENESQEQESTESTEPSVAELHPEEEKKESKKPESVPFNRFMKEKEKRKNLEKQLEDLKSQKEDELDDDSSESVDDDSEVSKLASEVEQMKLKERQRQLNAAFEKSFSQALENMPEYKDVVNTEVIRKMAFDPSNKTKTYKQLIEDAYGKAVPSGKQSVETATPRGGAKNEKLDIDRAQRDTEYRKEVLKDPELKKQYNEGLTSRVQI